MGFEHDVMAHEVSRLLLEQLRGGRADWATDRLTRATSVWPGFIDWPRPDFVFLDESTGASLAVEFKPPAQAKREYVTGLGQAVTYLNTFEYAAVVVPRWTEDRFDLGEYLRSTLSTDCCRSLPIALFVYERDAADPTDAKAEVFLRPRLGSVPHPPRLHISKVFWGYWRDLSQYDLLTLLDLMGVSRRRLFPSAFRHFWRTYMATGRARTWEGSPRKRRRLRSRSYTSEEVNANLSLRHVGVIDSSGNLTGPGYELLHLGRLHGPSSPAFMRRLSRLVLTEGRHLDLILWVDEQQRTIARRGKMSPVVFFRALDKRLQKAGIIKRAPVNRPKPTFLRDEQKLWNKLGLLIPSSGKSYFHPGVGLVFDWRSIITATGA